mmetsp:Transcript_17220/g.37186  ORF Transcript_17220/g.37186 Transcript_17220/m.37186 type:complete len:318 (-) Transcript_17220:1223-2176(-)
MKTVAVVVVAVMATMRISIRSNSEGGRKRHFPWQVMNNQYRRRRRPCLPQSLPSSLSISRPMLVSIQLIIMELRPHRTIRIIITVVVIIRRILLPSRPMAMARPLHHHILITMPRPNRMRDSITTTASIMYRRWYLDTLSNRSSHRSISSSRRRLITNNTLRLLHSQLPVVDISSKELYPVTLAFRHRRSIWHSHRWKRREIISFLRHRHKRLRRFARRKNYSREEVPVRMPPQPVAQFVVITAKSCHSTPSPILRATTITIENNRHSVTSSPRLHYSMIQISFTKTMVMYRLRDRMALQASIRTTRLCQALAFVGV